MQRLKNNDRGAVAVIVSLMIVPILILAALAIDVAAMHVDKQKLQTGADASVLAIAQDCARDDCGDTGDTAQAMTSANFNGDGAIGSITDFSESAGKVSVQTTSIREHWFGPIAGIDQTELQARSSARWGYPTGGTAVLPVAISSCELEHQSGVSVTRDPDTGKVIDVDFGDTTEDRSIYVQGAKGTKKCTGPSGLEIPGGFGWLAVAPGKCGKTLSYAGDAVASDPGASPPSNCTNEHFEKWLGTTVLLPIFDVATGQGSGGGFQIAGYAAFALTAYDLQGTYKHTTTVKNLCPDGRCFLGRFVRFVDVAEGFEYNPRAPQFGAAVVALTSPDSTE